MFASCGNCDAEYELDDAKIPAGGARLRCKNCDQYFVIVPSETTDLQSAADLAHDALSSEVPGEADSDFELEAAPGDDFDPDGESDWEFNDEVETPETEAEAGRTEPAFESEDEWGGLANAEDVVDDLLGPAGVIDADPAAVVEDLLGEIDTAGTQLDELTDDSPPGWESPSEDVESPSEEVKSPSEEVESPSEEVESPSEEIDLGNAGALAGSGVEPAVEGGASFDDLSDWDLFDEPAEADASALSSGSTSAPTSASRDGARGEPRVEIAVAMAEESPQTVRWTDRISEIAGWGAVSLMLIVSLVGGLASNSSDARAPTGRWSGAGFEADQIAGRWVDNAVGGSIYVVSGRIRRAPGSDPNVRKTLGIRLIDTDGAEIDRPPIPLAPAVPERILRESSPAELDAFQTRRAGRIAAVGTRWVSFEAVLIDLPRFAGRFELQAFDR